VTGAFSIRGSRCRACRDRRHTFGTSAEFERSLIREWHPSGERERESGTGKLEEAVVAYRAAMEEWTPEAAPYWHDIAAWPHQCDGGDSAHVLSLEIVAMLTL
jgi:hypothetical protein